MANCCTKLDIVEFRNPYSIPHTSDTALANLSCVDLFSSTMLNSGIDALVLSGTTVFTVFQDSDKLVRFEAPMENVDEGGAVKVNGISTAVLAMTSARGVASRYSDRRYRACAMSSECTVLIRRSALRVSS